MFELFAGAANEADFERWLPAPWGEGWYEVSDLGRVRSWHPRGNETAASRPRLLSPRPHKGGYQSVGFHTSQGRRSHTIHTLVLTAFVGPKPSPDHEGAHGNGDPSDNRLTNLRWATRIENAADRRAHGNQVRGQDQGSSRLTEESVRLIRAASHRTQRSLAEELGVSRSLIGLVRQGKVWGWLGVDESIGKEVIA